MSQQEQNQKYSNSNSGGCTGAVARSSKKFKQNKVPQRGLGVAQLEKIRLEEQQKRDAGFKVANLIISPTNSSSCLASTTDHPSSNNVTRQPPIIPNSIGVVRPNSFSKLVSNNGDESGMGCQGITSVGRSSWPNLWNNEYNLGGKFNYKPDHQVLNASRSSVNLPCETKNPVWPLTGVMPRSQSFHEACPSSMVNMSIGNSSSSVMNFQIEPPSNQSYRGNKSTPLWPDEEMMIGLKRSYPFSVDDAPVPSFDCRFPPAYISHIPTTDEPASFNNDGTFPFEQANPVVREGPSGTSRMSKYNKKIIKENGGFNEDFLTLAPPKPKDPPSYLGHYIPELPDFDSLPYQGAPDDQAHWPGQIQSVEQPFFSFLPSRQNGQSTLTKNHSNDVVGSVDLNLKL
ncbi:transcription factor SOX-4 [Heracleum sosnowskyi]|uniref:Transcription factor SOX-4 n=1 Tax=Heracleum sosnowskyi TaxID=360622 RepID=A0AAD8INM4_9APIA|nr:transcription factor SOX-4 [Heracleum sosnowskyi]